MSSDLDAGELTLPIKRTDGDTLEERLTDNAYHNILPARYLRKDADGELIEQQEDLFERVAKNIALAEAVFEADNEDVEITVTPDQLKPDHPRRDELAEEVFGKGTTADDDAETTLTEYNVNKFAYETIVPELPEGVRDHVEEVAAEFQDAMEQLSFMPNSPTLMNAGDELQQLSACFVDSPEDDIDDIHQTAKEAAQVFQCLTAETNVYVEGKGVVSIADVEPGDDIQQRDGDGHRTRRVEEVHAYDESPVFRVQTAAGVELTGTPNHELLVDEEWTRIDEIEQGETLSVRLNWIADEDATTDLTTVPAGGRWAENRTVSNEDILELYAEGLSDYDIADRLDSSASTIQRRRSLELGLDPNGSGGRSAGTVSFDTAEFSDLYESGHTDGEIAQALGVSSRSVARHRERQSLEPNGEPVKTVTQPTSLSADLAELVGLWVGDGSKHEDGIRFHLAREGTLERADRLCRDLFDEGLDWRWDDGCYEAVLHSHELKRWWLANFGDAKPEAANASVPEAVWRADRETIGAFLRGLYSADGSLQKGTYPRLWSASADLIDDVQQLLLGLGMPTTRWEHEGDDREYFNVGPIGERGLERFADLVGFVDERADKLRESLATTDLGGPSVGKLDGATWKLPVETVEDAGTDTVYDVTVADNHEYVASSVVSHNSGGGMGYAFWRLRPYGDPVGSTGGIASGPITFMRTYDQMCFPPGTRVLTPDGQRSIEDIDEGDLVVDENGDEQPVVETMERHVDEELIEITPERLNRPIRATGEHPFKVARDGEFEWVDAADLREDDLLVLGHATGGNDLALGETLDVSDVASGPLVFADGGVAVNREYYGAKKGTSPQSFASEVPVEAFATLAGWYLAEGCVVYRRGMPNEVTFTLHSDERDAAGAIQSALDSFDVPSRIETVEDRSTLHVHAEHSSFAQFVDSLFGTGASEKRVPELLWKAPPETQARVLEALFAGDGRLERRGQSQRVQLKLANEDIVDFAFQAGLRCGVQFSRHDREPEDRRPTYSVSASVSSALGTPLERLFDGVGGDFAARDRTKQANGREVVAIDSIERVDYQGPVYNAEVADTHTYVAEDLVVHNCETIAQGGARRGAQMGVMRVSHPDVIQFIHAKNKDVSLAHTLRLNDPDDYTHNSFAEALEEARDLIDDDGRVPKHLRNAVEGHLSNFNISVGVTDRFMEALKNGEEYTFTNPRTGEPHVATEQTKELYEMFDLGEYVEVGEVLSVPAELVWERIVEGAHENGEPGVIYLERVNKQHSFDVEENPEHQILATNPCGEQPLEEYEACNLGHINLSTLAATDAPDWRVWSERHADEYETTEAAIGAFLEEAIDWAEFDERIELGTRFLENVVTMSDFPVPEIEEKVREMRKIGLGIMGLAQLYIQLGISYGSDPANEVARQLMRHINHESKWTSHELAQQRGSFAEWDNSKYADPTEYREWFEHHTGLDADDYADGFPIRNHNTTTIAPTGCVEESSLVSTDDGLRPIEDLDDTGAEFEQWGEIEVDVTTDGGTKTATAVYDNGFAEVRRIETEGGFSVAATPDHRFRTITADGEYAWKEADDFRPGDRIVLQRGTFDGGSRIELDTGERDNYHHNTDENLTLPDEMGPELAEFLGYFMGDGYVHDEVGVKLVIESDAEDLDEHLRNLGESVFGVTPTVEDRDTRHVLTFGGRHLSRYFSDNGWKKDVGNEGEGAASAFVPEEVLRGDEAVAKRFLRGLFEADGTASRKIELSTVSATLAEQVQTLLLSLGCVFVRDVLEMDDRDDHYGDRPRHTLRGANKREDRRFLDEVGFITKSADIELTAQSYKNDTYPPAVVDALRDVDGYDEVSTAIKKRVNQSPMNGSVSRKLVRDVESATGETVRLDGRPLTDFYAAPVASVTEEMAYTKDISVPSNNTYVANGFVTHNTTSMVGNTTGGCEPVYNVAYYKNVSDDVQGDEMLVEFDDYFLRVLEANDIDIETVKQEAQEQMAENEFDGVEGLSTVPDAIGELFVTTGDLSAKEHAGVQTACQKGVDSAISKCLEEGTLVQTDSGVRPIESFADERPEPGEFVDVDENVTIDGVPVESQYYAGEKDATRVRVDNGTELVGATESHRVLTPDGWRVLGDLEEGDYVIGRRTESHGDGGSAIAFERRTGIAADGGATLTAEGADPSVYEKDVTLPERMSPRLARFLGMYAADGSAIDERYTIEITTSSEHVRDEARELFEELFDREPTVEEDVRGGQRRDTVYGVGLNSKPVWEFVTELCDSGSYEKEVPHEVLRGSPEEKRAFVNGVTLDGYVSSQSLVVYGGMSETLAEGVAELLRSFGVPKVYVGRKWVDESGAYSYHVHVTNEAQDLVTPIEPHKRVDRFDQRHRVYVSQDQVDKTEYDSRSTEYYAARTFDYRDRSHMFDETAENLGIEDAPPLYEVTDVEDAGTREMYDVELAGPHEYVVGGVVSHNTVNAPADSTVEDAKDVFQYIYDNGGKGVTYYRDGTRSKQVLTTRAKNTEFADEAEAAEALVEQIQEVFGGIEAFVESDEVQAAIDRQIEDLLGEVDREEEFAQKQDRPDVLHGVTQRIDTGYGKLYVNINEDPEADRPFELFANIGNSGGFTASFTEALAKTISTALRAGVDPWDIAEELQGIRSPKVAWDKGEQIQSIPDAIGTAMRRYLEGDVERAYPQQQTLEETAEETQDELNAAETQTGPEPDGGVTADRGGTERATSEDQQSLIESGESPECPECGSLSLYYAEGCKTCESCGWSEC